MQVNEETCISSSSSMFGLYANDSANATFLFCLDSLRKSGYHRTVNNAGSVQGHAIPSLGRHTRQPVVFLQVFGVSSSS